MGALFLLQVKFENVFIILLNFNHSYEHMNSNDTFNRRNKSIFSKIQCTTMTKINLNDTVNICQKIKRFKKRSLNQISL